MLANTTHIGKSMEYQQPEGKSGKMGAMSSQTKILCHTCNVDMDTDILTIHFPKGSLPAKGYRCPQCRDELIPLDEAGRVEKQAEMLGLFGLVNPLTKSITRCGNNLAVYIPKDYERQLRLRKGEKVHVWLRDDEIVIKAA